MDMDRASNSQRGISLICDWSLNSLFCVFTPIYLLQGRFYLRSHLNCITFNIFPKNSYKDENLCVLRSSVHEVEKQQLLFYYYDSHNNSHFRASLTKDDVGMNLCNNRHTSFNIHFGCLFLF